MATLNDDVKRFIVQALACYDTPSQVAEAVKEEFGLVIERQQVAVYDPTKKVGKALSQKWRDLFEETRKKFLNNISDIPIANQTFRLRALNRMFTRAESVKNVGLAAQLLEQASKEVGGAFTNRHELTGKNGGPLEHRVARLSDAELDAEIAKASAAMSHDGHQ
ncbi:DUF2280 domain-containing protein [Massilia aerilata]|uniref:DUF2280 domain-containing protein n=1 Tax=Massilia aerilata TaxID=453817 RepID=A0ABW0S668_9BURK